MSIEALAALAATPAAKKVVTRSSKSADDRYVVQEPADLARAAGLDLNTYALARMLRSEGFSGGPRAEVMTKIIMGQTAIHEAGGVSKLFIKLSATTPPKVVRERMIKEGLTPPTTPTRRFGRQGKWVGYAATTEDPRVIDVELAKAIIADQVPPIAKTGTNFLAPWRPGAKQAGTPLKDFEATILDWASKGKEWIGHVPGLDSFRFMAFKQTTPASALAKAQEAIAMYREGLKGNHAPQPWDVSKIAAVGGSAIAILAGFTALALFIYRRYYG